MQPDTDFIPIEAIPYGRFSSSGQRGGTSVERQVQLCSDFINLRGWPIGCPRFDHGHSGFHGHHRRADRELGKIEAEVASGHHVGKVLVVERLDRLSRQHEHETFNMITALLNGGISIATQNNGNLYRAGQNLDIWQIMPILIEARTSNEESAKKAERTAYNWKSRREKARAEGRAVTKMIPPWLSVDADKRFDIDEARAALVRRMFELSESGMGVWTMARLFNQEGTQPWERTGKSRQPKCWNQTFLARILRSRTVLGEFQPRSNGEPDGEPWEDYFPKIVDADLWNRVNHQKAAPTAVKGSRKNSAAIPNLFSGLLYCDCGAGIHYQRRRLEGHS